MQEHCERSVLEFTKVVLEDLLTGLQERYQKSIPKQKKCVTISALREEVPDFTPTRFYNGTTRKWLFFMCEISKVYYK